MRRALFTRQHLNFIADMLRDMDADDVMIQHAIRELKSVVPNFNEDHFWARIYSPKDEP